MEKEVASYTCYNIRVKCGSVINERWGVQGVMRATMTIRDWPLLEVDGALWKEAQKQKSEVSG